MTERAMEDLGRRLPPSCSLLRPAAALELGHWGGPRLVRGKRVLDLGCGDGRLAIGVAPFAREVVGLDTDPDAIAGATRRAREAGIRNVSFETGAGQSLPFPDGVFDVVILSWTL